MATPTTNLALVKAGAVDLFVDATGVPVTSNANLDALDAAIGPSAARTGSVILANSVTETQVSPTLTIPANSADPQSVYSISAYGTYNCTGGAAETVTFRLRIGGVAGTVIATFTSTASGTFGPVNWRMEGEVICVTNGAVASWLGSLTIVNNFPTANIANSATLAIGSAPVVRDSTIANALVLTMQHSVANANNTFSAFSGWGAKRTTA